ncbi:LysR family transcriptional regulator [Pelagibius sp. Alg239-R121]|uniref:LysR family transcriptional regulator n=1 Tax=Pelagibius sp. Alg239-R121 TaxID=2993448 RepID=UPI0024A787B4|nr:LysR family transcriptional regulator [Pelagibius sp. Alg239-R121]
MAIKLEALRVFVQVAELGNISDAADKLGRTPSAISMALKQLEENLEGALFESDRKTKLTALGQYTLDLSRGEVRNFDRAVAAMRAYARNEIGRLDIACVPSVASQLLPDIIGRFIKQRPGIELDLRDSDTAAVETAVERSRIDLGIAGQPRGKGPVDFEPLFRDRFVLVCAPESALAQRATAVDWQDLREYVLIDNGAAGVISSVGYKNLAQHTGLMVRNVTSLLGLVRSNIGVTLLPRLSVPRNTPGVATLDINDATAFREVGLLSRRGSSLSPAAAAFISLLREELTTRFADGTDLQPIQLQDQ